MPASRALAALAGPRPSRVVTTCIPWFPRRRAMADPIFPGATSAITKARIRGKFTIGVALKPHRLDKKYRDQLKSIYETVEGRDERFAEFLEYPVTAPVGS